ncbi:hypothetical protein BD410DRAFT_733965 [Rickenella mellea]|uniref:Uncharacterized protein n=1 Tax=Rickenella mellea TaxID=50990 RepID=A0A4Y7PGU7_9AGAM|nr:hypothetical protein BD410DRAFT_733965 [Rickenella mellea]
MEQHNTSRGPKLKKYRLSNEEWDVLKQLSPLLQRFLAATERISKSAVPLIHEVIPLIDSLTDTLAAAVLDEALHPVVRAAMARGVEVLNRYYSKTDDSVMYRLAMLLHPRYKTTYFTRQGWLTEWIDNAIALLREEYEKNYAGARVTESIVRFCYLVG